MIFKLKAVNTKKVFKLTWIVIPTVLLLFGIFAYFLAEAWIMIGCIPGLILAMNWVVSKNEYDIELKFSDSELIIDNQIIKFNELQRYSFDDDSVFTENVTFKMKNNSKISLIVSTKKQNKIVFSAFKNHLEEKIKF